VKPSTARNSWLTLNKAVALTILVQRNQNDIKKITISMRITQQKTQM